MRWTPCVASMSFCSGSLRLCFVIVDRRGFYSECKERSTLQWLNLNMIQLINRFHVGVCPQQELGELVLVQNGCELIGDLSNPFVQKPIIFLHGLQGCRNRFQGFDFLVKSLTGDSKLFLLNIA
mmetsp:Transcript_59806/g.172596  ORF Transcript_59806/g.172596 Transcript_59806/m.172596 type:complete len:124 (+) Transcript_59806:133-504(+)